MGITFTFRTFAPKIKMVPPLLLLRLQAQPCCIFTLPLKEWGHLQTCNWGGRIRWWTPPPPLLDGVVVEHRALDGDQPGSGLCNLLTVSSTYLAQLVIRYPPLLFCFLLVATTPPPVLRSFHPHSTHFCPSVHQHFSLEIRDLYSFHQLAIQRLVSLSTKSCCPFCPGTFTSKVHVKLIGSGQFSLWNTLYPALLIIET